jgi:hypothetical protein
MHSYIAIPLFVLYVWASPITTLDQFRGEERLVKTQIPVREIIPVIGTEPGAQRVRIRYGPYHIPAYSEKTLTSIITNEGGMHDAIVKDMMKPCEDCTVTRFKGNMVYADGSEANVDTGAWYVFFK